MLHRVFLPKLGQTMEEGTIEKWHKREGDTVHKGEVLLELGTDKATLEVEATASGVVKKLLAQEGQTLPVNQLIAIIGDPEDEIPEEWLTGGAEPVAAPQTSAAPPTLAEQPGGAQIPLNAEMPQKALMASPRARKVAAEQKVPLQALRGSGPGGRIVERDVLAYLERMRAVPCTPAARALAAERGVDLAALKAGAGRRRLTKADVLAGAKVATGREVRIPLSPMRQTIARRMLQSKQAAPHFYLMGEVLMRRAMTLVKESAASGRRITITALLVKAVGRALREHPRLNARVEGSELVLNQSCNVGVAVAVEDGLFVPVIRQADQKSLEEVAAELQELAEAARAGKLTPAQYEGGSVTISNLGMYGVSCFVPIINPPESCIIGVGAIADQPVALGGVVTVEPVMKVTVSADHRVVDGVQAAQFFKTLKELLEAPEQLAR